MESVDLGGVEAVGRYAFGGCYSLFDTGRLGSIVSIGEHAFHGCRSLVSVTLADTLETLGASAFYDCRSLETLSFEGNMPEIGADAVLADTIAEIFSSHAASWSDYVGVLRVVDDGSGFTWIVFLLLVVVLAMAVVLFVIRRSGRRSPDFHMAPAWMMVSFPRFRMSVFSHCVANS